MTNKLSVKVIASSSDCVILTKVVNYDFIRVPIRHVNTLIRRRKKGGQTRTHRRSENRIG